MCCYSVLHTLYLYKTKQNWGYQLQAKMNMLSHLQKLWLYLLVKNDILYIKFRCLYFVIGDVIL